MWLSFADDSGFLGAGHSRGADNQLIAERIRFNRQCAVLHPPQFRVSLKHLIHNVLLGNRLHLNIFRHKSNTPVSSSCALRLAEPSLKSGFSTRRTPYNPFGHGSRSQAPA